jgi:hypothetical protein
MRRDELLVIAAELILEESGQPPLTAENFRYELHYALCLNELRIQEENLSARQMAELDHRAETYANHSSAAHSVNRPDEFDLTVAAARNCRCCQDILARPTGFEDDAPMGRIQIISSLRQALQSS